MNPFYIIGGIMFLAWCTIIYWIIIAKDDPEDNTNEPK